MAEKKNQDHETAEGPRMVNATDSDAVAQARRLHHLASADPEPERDGTQTGPSHERQYGLERAEGSAAYWRSVGVEPFENRALKPGDDGFDDAVAAGEAAPFETADAPRASDSK